MKSKIALSATFAAALTAALPAMADDAGFYAYGSAGWTDTSRKAQADAVVSNLVTSYTTSADEKSTGYKLQGGYRFNRYIAVETGYVDLGKYNYKAASTAPIVATRDVDLKADGWTLGAVGSLPVADSVSLIGKLGVLGYKLKYHCAGTGVPCANPDRSENGTSMFYGVGAEWNFTGNWFARLEYEVFRDLGSTSDAKGLTGTSKADIRMGSVALGYRF